MADCPQLNHNSLKEYNSSIVYAFNWYNFNWDSEEYRNKAVELAKSSKEYSTYADSLRDVIIRMFVLVRCISTLSLTGKP